MGEHGGVVGKFSKRAGGRQGFLGALWNSGDAGGVCDRKIKDKYTPPGSPRSDTRR